MKILRDSVTGKLIAFQDGGLIKKSSSEIIVIDGNSMVLPDSMTIDENNNELILGPGTNVSDNAVVL